MKRLLLSSLVVLFFAVPASAYWPHASFAQGQAYTGAYHAPSAYINGGFVTPFGYQPYSMTLTPTYGGAIYQGNSGMFWGGGYSPYSFGGYVPSYGGYGYGYPGYGYGWGMY